jgi:hypothetical protein
LFKGIASKLSNCLIDGKVDSGCIELSISKPKVLIKYIYPIKRALYDFVWILTVKEVINLLEAISAYIEFDVML